MRLPFGVSGAIRKFSYFMSSGTHYMPEGVDYMGLYGSEPNATELCYAIFANVLEYDEEGNVTNWKYAEKRATDSIRAYCDSSFSVVPAYEDWEIELY